jgi:hypothetical protein
MTDPSKPPPPGTPPPSGPPPGPRHPVPTRPPSRYVDSLFALALSLGEDVAIDSGRGGEGSVERASRPVLPDSEGGRAGAFPVRPGAVSGFALPHPLGPPRFGGEHLQVKQPQVKPPLPGQPQPRPKPGPQPPPPPPVITQYDALPRWAR